MAHDCEMCGQACFCDQDDTGGLPQPNNCYHFTRPQDYPDCPGIYGDEDAECATYHEWWDPEEHESWWVWECFLPRIQDECSQSLAREIAAAKEPLRVALGKIEGWSRHFKTEPRTTIRSSLRLIHEASKAALSSAEGEGESDG